MAQSAALLVVCLAASCASSHDATTAQRDPLVAPPDDFVLHVLTMDADTMPPAVESGAPGAGSQFVVSADGVLRADRAPYASTNTVPPIVRTLSRRQMADLWSLLRELGLANAQAGQEPRNPSLVAREAPRPAILITVKADDRSRLFVSSRPDGETADPAAARLVEHVRALAWFGDENGRAMVEPKRYDFGPDPYARYRNDPVATPPPSQPAGTEPATAPVKP